MNETIIEFLKNSEPINRHRFVLDWNWDMGGDAIFYYIAGDPNTDRATALALYWKTCPRNLKKYANREEAEARFCGEDFELIQKIENLYLSGFYKNQRFAFDPTNDRGGDWTTEYPEIKIKTEIPSVMFEKLIGEDVGRDYEKEEDWEDGVPLSIWEKLDKYEVID